MSACDAVPVVNARSAGRSMPQLGSSELGYVFSIAMKYVKDEEAAADVAQEALLLAHRHRHSFRGDSRFTTWLYRIAATTALMHLRTRRRRSREVLALTQSSEDVAIADNHRTEEPAPDVQVARTELMAHIERCLDQLGDKYRRIFWMRYLEGYTETEIASRLDLTLATVKTRAYRARVAVRNALDNPFRHTRGETVTEPRS